MAKSATRLAVSLGLDAVALGCSDGNPVEPEANGSQETSNSSNAGSVSFAGSGVTLHLRDLVAGASVSGITVTEISTGNELRPTTRKMVALN